MLGKGRIDGSKRQHVKCEIPGGIPGILPLVRHRQDIAGKEMPPVIVAAGPALERRRRRPRVSFQPFADHVVIELLRPEQPGARLTHVITITPKTFMAKLISPLIRLSLPKQTREAMAAIQKILKTG